MKPVRPAESPAPGATGFEPKRVRTGWSGYAITLALALGVSGSFAQYNIDWFKIAGGGGVSTGAAFSIASTIGQFDPGVTMTNGAYSLSVWALPAAVQTPGAPVLHIVSTGPGLATIWWTTATPGFVLQSADRLVLPYWVDAPTGSNNPVTLPASQSSRFYRLLKR